MKNQSKSKAFKMIEKFDLQLRNMLVEEIKALKSTKKHIAATMNLDNNDLMVA